MFREYVESEGIELHRTRGKTHFVERFNRTLKDMLFKRIEADEKKQREYTMGGLFTRGAFNIITKWFIRQ